MIRETKQNNARKTLKKTEVTKSPQVDVADKQYINEIVLGIFLLVLLLFFWNPWYLWMPEKFEYLIVGGLGILVALYAGLILREKPQDEREEKLQAQAGRIGFVVGIIVLAAGAAYQVLTSSPDPIIILALALMVIVKVFVFKKGL